jgi:hypothetical protein
MIDLEKFDDSPLNIMGTIHRIAFHNFYGLRNKTQSIKFSKSRETRFTNNQYVIKTENSRVVREGGGRG